MPESRWSCASSASPSSRLARRYARQARCSSALSQRVVTPARILGSCLNIQSHWGSVGGVRKETAMPVTRLNHAVLYARDPDGLEFEVSWLVPAELIDDETRRARATTAPLDLEAAKRKYGSTTRGGVGVSTPVG